MVNFINSFVSSEAFQSFISMFDGFKNTPIIIKTFYGLLITSFVIFIIRRVLFGR